MRFISIVRFVSIVRLISTLLSFRTIRVGISCSSGKQKRSCVCCIYEIHPWSISPEFAHMLDSLAQFRHDFGALFLHPTNPHVLTYFKNNKLSFFRCADHWKIVFNIRSVQNADCRMHRKNMQKVISKSTTLGNGTWKTDWWSMFLSKLDQNHAALLKFISWRAGAMRGLNSLNLGSAESFFTSSSSIKLLVSSQFL